MVKAIHVLILLLMVHILIKMVIQRGVVFRCHIMKLTRVARDRRLTGVLEVRECKDRSVSASGRLVKSDTNQVDLSTIGSVYPY